MDDPFDLSLVSDALAQSVYREGNGSSTASDAGSNDSFLAQGTVVGDDFGLEEDANSKSTGTTKTRGLSPALQKELVLAIEARGGIERCSTKKLLEDYPEYRANKKLETAIGNKVSRWKNKYRHDYEKLKLSFATAPDLVGSNITVTRAHSVPSSPARRPPRHQNRSVPSSPARPPLRNQHSQRTPPPSLASPLIPTLPSFSPPPDYQYLYSSPSPPPRPFVPLPAGAMMSTALTSLLLTAKIIKVDMSRPEQNSPFMIYPFRDHELATGRIANGFIIQVLDVDPRHNMSKFTGNDTPSYEAFHIGGPEVLMKVPSTSYTFVHDEASEKAGLTKGGVIDACKTQPIHVARNSINRDVSRKFQAYRLIFPVALENDILSPGSENGLINPKNLPVISKYTVTTSKGDASIQSFRSNIHWEIAENENEVRSTKQNKKKNALDEQANEMFEGM